MLLLCAGPASPPGVNAIMVVIKLGVLLMFVVIALTAFDGSNFTDFTPLGKAAVGTAAGTIFFSFIGLDAVSTAGDEVKDPQRTMPRALIAALIIVIVFYVLVAFAALGTQPWTEFEGQQEAGLAKILEVVTGANIWGTILALGAVISIFSRHAGHALRADPHPLRDGPRRHAAAGLREGQPAHRHAGQQHDHRRGRRRDPRGVRAAGLPHRRGLDRHPDRVRRSSRSA